MSSEDSTERPNDSQQTPEFTVQEEELALADELPGTEWEFPNQGFGTIESVELRTTHIDGRSFEYPVVLFQYRDIVLPVNALRRRFSPEDVGDLKPANGAAEQVVDTYAFDTATAGETGLPQEMSPIPGDVTLTLMDHEHIEDVKSLWRYRLTPSDEKVDAFTHHALLDDHPSAGIVAVDSDRVVGFGLFTMTDPSVVSSHMNHPHIRVPCWQNTGLLQTLVVDPEREEEGIGTQLLAWQLQYINAHYNDGAVCLIRHRENAYDPRDLVQKLGFEVVGNDPEFFATRSENSRCIDCEGACTCGGTIARLEFPLDDAEIQVVNSPWDE